MFLFASFFKKFQKKRISIQERHRCPGDVRTQLISNKAVCKARDSNPRLSQVFKQKKEIQQTMIKQMQKTLLALLLINISTQCGEGCLKCSTTTQCELCDSLNAYVLQEGLCTQHKEQFCKEYNLEGRCKSCQTGYYLEDQVNRCVPVENMSLVENCFEYNNQSLCNVCNQNYYLSDNKCIEVDLKIERCLIYDTSKTCASCEPGFLVSISQKKCLPVIASENCLSYSLNKCTKCDRNSYWDNKLYFQDFLEQKALDFSGLNKYETFMYFKGLPVYYQEFCIKTTIPNCLEFKNYKTCQKCMSGFFLSGNECRENPGNFISNCLRYKSKKECLECSNGFYLSSQTKCTAVDMMNGCQVYDGTANFSSCLRCHDDMYLQTSTTCATRKNLEIQNCQLLDAKIDQCRVCESGFRLSQDFLKCFPLIEKCSEYDETVTSTTSGNICQRCEKGFFLATNTCQEGTVMNCEIYEVSANVCAICLNEYYLQEGVCNLHSSLSYCQTYSPTTQGVCDLCQLGTQQFTQHTSCDPVTQIENCVKYSDINTCQECEQGYDRTQNSCQMIPEETNCIVAEDGVCQQCKEDFYLEGELCLKPIYNEILNCHEKGNIVSGYQKCKTCEEFHVSYNYAQHRVCMNVTEPDFSKYISETAEIDSNCKVMRMSAGTFDCLECAEDFVLNEEFTCVAEDTCTGTKQRVVLILDNNRITDFRKNVCLSATSSCELHGISLKTNDSVQYKCVKCKSGYDQIIEFTSNEELIVLAQDNKVETSLSTFKVIKSVCESHDQIQRRPSQMELSNFENCKYWYKFELFGEKGCQRCEHGFTGKVQNWGVTNCFQYSDNQKCLQCINGYEIDDTGLKCTPIVEIQHCSWYKENISTCQKCNDEFFLITNECRPVTQVQGCVQYEIYLNNRCVECEGELFLHKNTSNQQFCIEPIYKCNTYRYISSNNDSVVCSLCADGYYPDSKEGCIEGTVENCWQYEQVSMQNVCKKYINQIPFLSENVCQRVEPMEGCVTYTTSLSYTGQYEIVCSVCNSETHYKSGDICCPHGMFNNDGVCDYILINECQQSTDALSCDVCMEYYSFDVNMAELSVPYKCCEIGTYWNPIESQCSQQIEVEGNGNHCLIFDIKRSKSCLVCENGFYISQNQRRFADNHPDVDSFPYFIGYCCEEGTQYSYSVENGHSCETISIENCLQVNNVYTIDLNSPFNQTQTTECTKCMPGFIKEGQGENTVCCDEETEYFDSTANACQPKPEGCKTYNIENNFCTECLDSHKQYIHTVGANQIPNRVICCNYNASPRMWYQEGTSTDLCTEQGATQYDVSFEYEGDEHCILTDFNSSHTLISEASCIKCTDGFSPSGYKSMKCCPEGSMWNGVQEKCLPNKFFNNCAHVKILTALTDSFCTECRDGYYLNNGVCTEQGLTIQRKEEDIQAEDQTNPNPDEVNTNEDSTLTPVLEIVEWVFEKIVSPNCLEIENGLNEELSECLACEQGFILEEKACQRAMMITIGTEKYNIVSFVKNCAIFNESDNICTMCKLGAQKLDENLCCMVNEQIVDNECVQTEDEAIIANHFEERYPIENCIFYEDKTCTKCHSGFILVDGQCISVMVAQEKCDYNIINEHCEKTTEILLEQCQCNSCAPHAYLSNDVCCPHGTMWNDAEKHCVKLADPLCAKHDGTLCTECFHDPSKKLVTSQFTYYSTQEKGMVIGVANEQLKSTLPSFSSNYYVSSGICCQVGTYNKNGLCEPILITNCKGGELSQSGIFECTTCQDMSQTPDQDKQSCIPKSDQNDYYTPKNSPIKIEKGYYWDHYEQMVNQIFDPNCDSTNDPRTCDQCLSAHRLSFLRAKFQLYIPPNAQHDGVYKTITVQLCMPDSQDLMDNQVLRKYNNCIEWDDTKNCTKCIENYYLSNELCCQIGYVAILSDTFKYCIPIQMQQEGCSAYDITLGTCKVCKSSFTLSFGVCCPDKTLNDLFISKTYVDIFSQNFGCNLEPRNCAKYNDFSQECEICNLQHSLINNQCIESEKHLEEEDLIITKERMPGCLQLNNNYSCKIPESNYYLHNGSSCAVGFYNPQKDSGTCLTPLSEKGERFQKCAKINELDRCLECTPDSYLDNGDCCQMGKYFDINVKKCIPIYKFKNCLNGWFDKSKDCQKCQDGYYLSRGFCVEEGKLVIDEIGTEKDIMISKCIQAQNTTSCQKCQGDQIIFNNTCQFYIDIDEDQRIAECKIIKSGSPPTCLECKDERYMNNGNCCSYGFYHNGQSCQSLKTVSLNCKKLIRGQCAECMNNDKDEKTYFSNSLACCADGFYASSSTLCSQIEIDNCLQTHDGERCEKCNNGFNLDNGVCVTLPETEIDNCSIAETISVSGIDSVVCIVCTQGFYVNTELNICVPQSTTVNCLQWEENKKNCLTCEENMYWDGEACCNVGFFSYLTGVPSEQIMCQTLNFVTLADCSKVENGKCIECSNGNKVNGGVCCPVGQFATNGVCSLSPKSTLQKCRKFLNADQCEYLSDYQGNDVSCSNNNYWNQFSCCPLGTYGLNGSCVQMPSSFSGCQKLRGGMCTQCVSLKQLSRGKCVDVGKTYNIQNSIENPMIPIVSIPNCTKLNEINPVFCDSCANTNNLTLNNFCCSSSESIYYSLPGDLDNARSCVLVVDGVKSVDFITGNAVECVGSDKYPTGSSCCAVSEYWDGTNNACAAATTATNCQKFIEIDTDSYDNCAECIDTFQLIIDSGVGGCIATQVEPHKFIKVDTTLISIPSDNYNYCTQMNTSYVCSYCNPENSYLLFEGCVEYNKIFTNVGSVYTIGDAITNCKKALETDPTASCELCQLGFTLVDPATCTQQDQTYPNQNCAILDTQQSTICAQCESNAFPYTNGTDKTICCSFVVEDQFAQTPFSTEVANYLFDQCQPFMIEIHNCLHYDQNTNQCVECVPEYYLSNQYVCCQEGFYFNTQKRKCQQIESASKCLREIDLKCLKCDPDFQNFYLNNGKCIEFGKYFDVVDTTNSPIKDLAGNCKKAKDESADQCEECLEGYIQFDNTCCPIGKFKDTNGECVSTTIQNCHEQSGEKICKTCDEGYVLFNQNSFFSSQDDLCCSEFQFYDKENNTCVYEQTIEQFDANCEKWDRVKMSCAQCKSPWYLTNGRCCEEQNFFHVIKAICTPIPTSSIPNCLQLNDQNVCVKCAPDYFIKAQDKKCYQPSTVVENCLQYDNQVAKCTKCAEGRYLLRNKCPLYKQSVNASDGAFSPLNVTTEATYDIENCLIYAELNNTSNKCSRCDPDSNTYLTNQNQKCCPFDQYYNNSASQCQVTNAFPNCQQYATNDPHNCLQCDKGYFLAVLKNGLKRCVKFSTPDQECLLSEIGVVSNKNSFKCTKCKNEGIEYVLQPDPDRNQIFVEFEPISNCEFYETTNLLSTSSLKCLQCIDNDLNYLSTQGEVQSCNVRTQTIGDVSIKNCCSFEPDSDNCKDCEEGFHLGVVSPSGLKRCLKNPQNCKIYDNTTNPSAPYCTACVENYTMILVNLVRTCVPESTLVQEETEPPTFYPGYLTDCQPNEFCKDEFLGGLSGSLDRLFSCHVCDQDGYIPFVSVRTEGEAISGIQQYMTPINQTDRQDLGSDFFNSQCLRISGETFGIPEGDFNFPLNCALGIINANLPAVSDSTYFDAQKTRLGVYCSACEPGYRALKSNVFEDLHHIYECAFISNCEEKGKAFNQCDFCKDGYTFRFEDGVVMYDECVEFKKDPNCFVTQEIDGVIECRYCNEGFSFNYDGLCEIIKLGICEDNVSELLHQDRRPLITELEFALLRFRNGFGCQQCPADQVKFTLPNPDRSWFCSYSDYLFESELDTTTIYDPLCKNYFANDSSLVCHTCHNDAVLNENNQCILRTQELNNCEKAKDSEYCLQCSSGYVNSLGECVFMDIDNCLNYEVDPISGEIICLQCDIGHGLRKNVCVKDLYNPCEIINIHEECVACQFGYNLLQLNGTKKECVPVSSHQNCSAYNADQFNIKNIQCTKCSSNEFILNQLEVPIKVCNQLITIRNCLRYDIRNTFLSSSLNCLECNPAYYLQDNECFFRRNTIDNCLSYEQDSDICTSCANTHYLDSISNQCIENPSGIDFCRVYENTSACSVCNTNYFLTGGKCLLVEQEKIVQGCFTYDSSQACVECQTEQLKVDGQCLSILALNCLTFKNEKECEQCTSGFEIEKDEIGIISCVQIEKPVIQNCHEVSDTKPFNCLLCFEHHYFDGEKCIAVDSTNKIEQCEVYENQTGCKKCQKYHILSQDKQLCVLEKNRNCEYFEEQKQGFCVRCQPGYVFNSDSQCVLESTTTNQNCLLREAQGSQCLVCQSGYSMNTPGTCSENKQLNQNQSASLTEKPVLSGVVFMNVFSMMILAFFY